jgi:uncharacterized membrane protein YgdD (TMEM256/DUF423 family)
VRLRFLAAAGAIAAAFGIALMAYAAHAFPDDSRLGTAAQFLFVQGPAVMAATGLIAAGLASRRFGPWCLVVVLAGLMLFSGDLGLKGARAGQLFSMAAPIGGMAMIGGWLGFALALLFRKS